MADYELMEETFMRIAEFIERTCLERRICQELGYDMEAVDNFIIEKMSQEKERFDNMSTYGLISVMCTDMKNIQDGINDLKNVI